MENEEIVKNAYENLNSVSCYSGIDSVYREAKKQNPKLTKKDVENALVKIKSFSLHKPRRIRFKRLKTIPIGYMTHMQADLADFQRVSAHNDGYRYLLVCVDVLSRQIYVAPVHSKSSDDMIKAFSAVFKTTPMIPQFLFTDKGLEFQAKELKRFYAKSQLIKQVAQSPDVKAAMAERTIRTIKTRLYKYFTHKETVRWVDVIDKLVDSLNHSINRSIKMRPADVNFENGDALWDRLYGSANNRSLRKQRLKTRLPHSIGDHVRIAKAKKDFEKGYLPNYTQEVFTIENVKKNESPQNYRLIDQNGQEIVGKFYKEELSRAVPDPQRLAKRYIIEKVLATRTRKGQPEYLVKWEHMPIQKAVWIRRSDIII